MENRRADYDVTNNIQISSTQAVSEIVIQICRSIYPKAEFSYLERSFVDFENLYEGYFNGYHACDTFYHDKQHSLDMTLALARIIEGYDQICKPEDKLSPIHITITLITALYHDSGYIREEHDPNFNGAIYTKTHVTRSATFLARYFESIGLNEYISIASNIVHYTGYELAPEKIILPEGKFHILGYMLGTADLIAQMSDRYYLEKCRDRLFPEFVLGGIAEDIQANGSIKIIYKSGDDLLKKTPAFYQNETKKRLEKLFQRVYQFAGIHFGSQNFYLEELESKQNYLNDLINNDQLNHLQRIPLNNKGAVAATHTSIQEIKDLAIK